MYFFKWKLQLVLVTEVYLLVLYCNCGRNLLQKLDDMMLYGSNGV